MMRCQLLRMVVTVFGLEQESELTWPQQAPGRTSDGNHSQNRLNEKLILSLRNFRRNTLPVYRCVFLFFVAKGFRLH